MDEQFLQVAAEHAIPRQRDWDDSLEHLPGKQEQTPARKGRHRIAMLHSLRALISINNALHKIGDYRDSDER